MISLICSIYKNKKQKQIHNTEDKPRVARKRGGGGSKRCEGEWEIQALVME